MERITPDRHVCSAARQSTADNVSIANDVVNTDPFVVGKLAVKYLNDVHSVADKRKWPVSTITKRRLNTESEEGWSTMLKAEVESKVNNILMRPLSMERTISMCRSNSSFSEVIETC
jgi:hypothetical protein